MTAPVHAVRACSGPIIHQGMCRSLDGNINGPSLIRRPGWAPGPGRYMLYFAHHFGRRIRLAFADHPTGPWQVHSPGVLPLAATPLAQTPPPVPQPEWAVEMEVDGLYPHLASPDVHVDHLAQRFEMWFHGLADDGEQPSYYATSADGLDWQVGARVADQSYLRIFQVDDQRYAVALGGALLRWDGARFQPGASPLSPRIRHAAVLPLGQRLVVVYSCRGDAPERLFLVQLDITGDWTRWRPIAPPTEIMRPEHPWEGAALPVTPSQIGAVGFANQLRDPALMAEDGTVWLVYSGGGEAALGLARIEGLGRSLC